VLANGSLPLRFVLANGSLPEPPDYSVKGRKASTGNGEPFRHAGRYFSNRSHFSLAVLGSSEVATKEIDKAHQPIGDGVVAGIRGQGGDDGEGADDLGNHLNESPAVLDNVLNHLYPL
jgi:hypothetical protein